LIITKNLLPLQPFSISLKDLKPGRNDFSWHADKRFFENFGNSDIKDADINIQVSVVCHGCTFEAHGCINGSVTVACDRCLDDLIIPVSAEFEENEDEDLSQDIYDYVCTSLPLQRVHPENECNPEVLKYLSK